MKFRVSFLATVLFCICPGLACSGNGFDTIKAAEQLYTIYSERDYFDLEAKLATLDPGDQRREFFEGQLDAAFLHNEQAEKKLRRFLELPGMEPDWRKEALLTLGTSQLRDGDYEAAARDFAQALNEPSVRFTTPERVEAEQNLALARALQGTPPQSRSDHEGASTVNATRGRGGTKVSEAIYIDARINGLTEEAILDTGANFSLASTSFARRHHLHFLKDEISFTNSVGAVVSSRIALADEVQIGKMIFHHVVFAVVQDKNSNFPGAGVTIDVVVGSPLIIPLGHLRIAPDGDSMEIGLPSDPNPDRSSLERNLVFDRLLPLMQLRYQSNPLLFVLDTGMDRTFLLRRFGWNFPQALLGSVLSTEWRSGAGSTVTSSVQILPRLELNVGKEPISLSDTRALTEDQPAYPPVFGVIGEDFLAGGFELDFHQMHFTLLKADKPQVLTTP